MDELSGKSALVTGGGSGLGRAIAHAFAGAGARVMIAGRTIARLEETAAANPDRIRCVAGDVTAESDRARMVAAAQEALGGLDILVNSAGILEGGTVENTSLDA